MPRLHFAINLTLDGCIDHEAALPDPDVHRAATRNFERADALLIGRVTYQLMEAGWRSVAETGARADWMTDWMMPFAHTMHRAKKYVATTTLADAQVDWNAERLQGELGTAVRQLKAQPGDGTICVCGAHLGFALTEWGLIDDYEFWIHPRIAGRGPTLFAGLSKLVALRLVGREAFASGIVAVRYEAGP